MADSNLDLRALAPQDDAALARVIRQVLKEFGADREGFAFVDEELDRMSAHYQGPNAGYHVLVHGDRIVGGGGFAPLRGGDPVTAELKKMYFLPDVRGQGFGRKLIENILRDAQKAGYQQIYLETTEGMKDALRLYEKLGFQRLSRPMGQTGHFACQVWLLRNLR